MEHGIHVTASIAIRREIIGGRVVDRVDGINLITDELSTFTLSQSSSVSSRYWSFRNS
jgi:hypothetical protein